MQTTWICAKCHDRRVYVNECRPVPPVCDRPHTTETQVNISSPHYNGGYAKTEKTVGRCGGGMVEQSAAIEELVGKVSRQ